jgi:hypothetical protein
MRELFINLWNCAVCADKRVDGDAHVAVYVVLYL